MNQCKHNWSDPHTTCSQCELEDKIDALRTELTAVRLELKEVETDRDNLLKLNQHMLTRWVRAEARLAEPKDG